MNTADYGTCHVSRLPWLQDCFNRNIIDCVAWISFQIILNSKALITFLHNYMYHVCYQFLIIHTHTTWFFAYNRQSLDILMYTTTDVFAWQLYAHTYTTTPLLDHLQQQWNQARVLNSLSFIVLLCWHWTTQQAQKLRVPKVLKYSVVQWLQVASLHFFKNNSV